MKCTDFAVGDRIRNVVPVRFYRFQNPKFAMYPERPELWDLFRYTDHTGDKIPSGTVVQVIGTVREIYTELEVVESSHPGVEVGQRVVGIVVTAWDWQKTEIPA